jgi:DNA repair protein SbcC/Rad50
MRISRLSFSGFGPYREMQVIDFDQLGDSGLYLINGPTGAGKTTVIDAICFALYGKLANDDADPSRMRSDFCAPADPTRVELTFESSAGRFIIERSPDYQRARARGEGTTRSHAECKVHRIAPDGTEHTIATQIASANAEIARLVGLTREQFVQTIVLPQGQFATFLNADTRDREALLKRIFDTRLYERVAAILKDRAKQAAQADERLTDQIVMRINDLCESLDIPIDERVQLIQRGRDSLDEPLLEAMRVWQSPLRDGLDAAIAAENSAQDSWQAADDARAKAKAEADAVAGVVAAERSAATTEGDVVAARESLQRQAEAASGLSVSFDDSADPALWRQRATECAQEIGALQGLLEAEGEVARFPARDAERAAAITKAEQQAAEHHQRLAAIPAEITQHEVIRQARPTVEQFTAAHSRKAEITAAQEKQTLLAKAREDEVVLSTRAEQALASTRAATAAAEAAARAYREGIAAHLAGALIPGDPCAVCGSTEHPDPARFDAEVVDYDEVEALRAAERECERVLSEESTRLTDCRQRISEAQTQITMSIAEIEQALAQLDEEQRDLDRRRKSADTAEKALEALGREQQRLTEAIGNVEVELAKMTQVRQGEAQRIEELTARLTHAIGEFDGVSARIEALQGVAEAMQALADRLQARHDAETTLTAARARRQGFPDRAGFADIDGAQVAWNAATEARDAARESRQAAESALEAYQRRVAELEADCSERAELAADNRDLLHLSAAFNPGRGEDVGLHIFVLRTMFAQVMDLANTRFQALLNGRYRLVPTEAGQGDGRRLQGLELSVEDALTGKSRSARSLSGGEMFCASLALALGLSDAVRNNAGGVQISSLFIDEGFGSLDSDQLDEVMSMLNHLSSNGRRVGLISHVDSMKQAITERIEVAPATADRPASLAVSWMS